MNFLFFRTYLYGIYKDTIVHLIYVLLLSCKDKEDIVQSYSVLKDAGGYYTRLRQWNSRVEGTKMALKLCPPTSSIFILWIQITFQLLCILAVTSHGTNVKDIFNSYARKKCISDEYNWHFVVRDSTNFSEVVISNFWSHSFFTLISLIW